MKKLLSLALIGATITGANAETYPSHPVTVIVPFAAGGPADITGPHRRRHPVAAISASSSWWRTSAAPAAPPGTGARGPRHA